MSVYVYVSTSSRAEKRGFLVCSSFTTLGQIGDELLSYQIISMRCVSDPRVCAQRLILLSAFVPAQPKKIGTFVANFQNHSAASDEPYLGALYESAYYQYTVYIFLSRTYHLFIFPQKKMVSIIIGSIRRGGKL